jgi:hypothetical protein
MELPKPQMPIAELPDDTKIITTIGVMREAFATQRPQAGCICPGDATPLCQNQFCPRKPVRNVQPLT